MKFAHLSDLHIGSWRDERLRDVSMTVFLKSIDMCRQEKVDFILFAGDLFNTAFPAVDKLAIVARVLRELKEDGIPVYVIPGSHDFSPSGTTMIDVLEQGGLLVNVYKGDVVGKQLRLKYTIDKKTGAKITGILGKKGMLDRAFYEDLDREHIEREQGYKIFMFHTALQELRPIHLEHMEAQPVSLLPRGFDYYAGGHVHHRMEFSASEYKKVTQPGALFPNNFAELEKYGNGGFFIVHNDVVEWKAVNVRERIALTYDVDGKKADDVSKELLDMMKTVKADTLVTLRVYGKLSSGQVSDITFNDVMAEGYARGAYVVLKNTAALSGKEFQEVDVQADSIEQIEEQLIQEHLKNDSAKITLVKELMQALSAEKKEGETTKDFEERVKEDGITVLKLDVLK